MGSHRSGIKSKVGGENWSTVSRLLQLCVVCYTGGFVITGAVGRPTSGIGQASRTTHNTKFHCKRSPVQ